MKGLPIRFKVIAFEVGSWIGKTMTPKMVSMILLFILSVARVACKVFTSTNTTDDEIVAIAAPYLEKIAEELKKKGSWSDKD